VAVSAVCLEGQMKRFMLLLDLKRRCLVSFDSGWALKTINQGLPVVPFGAITFINVCATISAVLLPQAIA
jgi:hypothetical protein